MPHWEVEIASRPGLAQPGFLTREITAIGAAVEDAVDRGELVSGSGSVSADGRIGGEWVVEASSAEEATVKANEVLRRAFDALDIIGDDAVVDHLNIEPSVEDD